MTLLNMRCVVLFCKVAAFLPTPVAIAIVYIVKVRRIACSRLLLAVRRILIVEEIYVFKEHQINAISVNV